MLELKHHLALFGYRGSGKTTTARLLAASMDVPWVDTDALVIEAYEGRSIKSIWETYGEAHFRQTEARQCIAVLSKPPCIIAMGGGAIIQDKIRDAYHVTRQEKRLKSIYLHAEVDTLFARIHSDADTAANRPAMSRFGGGRQEISDILAQRDPIYRSAADKIISVDRLEPDEVKERILAILTASL